MDVDVSSADVAGLRLRWAARSIVGNIRSVNEDCVLAVPGLFVVADGMGGHAAGDIASRLTVESLGAHADVPMPISRVEQLVSDANRSVINYARANDRGGMGSTLVGAALVDNGGTPAVLVFHVGDSRCYRVGTDRMVRLTRDHSHVQELVDAGTITEWQAARHPARNVVTRAIGIDDHVAADYVVVALRPHVRLVLCSDGVHGEVNDAALHTLASSGACDEVAEQVMEAVLRGRAGDNASVIVVDIDSNGDGRTDDLDVTGPRLERPAFDLVDAGSDLISTVPIDLQESSPSGDNEMIEGILT